MHAHCWRALRTNAEQSPAGGVPTGELVAQAGESVPVADETIAADALLLIDLYRDLGTHLPPEMASGGSRAARSAKRKFDTLPLHLLEGVHQLAQDVWFPRATLEDRDAVSAAYALHHQALSQLAGVSEPARATAPVAR